MISLEARAVSVVMDRRTIVAGAQARCTPGTMTALVGPSGCGKTTLLNCLGLLQKPTSGDVMVGGEVSNAWSSGRRRRFWRDHGAFVLQDYGVMEEESVGFNVTMSASLLGGRTRGDLGRMHEVLGRTGLAGRQDESAAHLSGGEKQRLAVARAMYRDAQVVFVDEPTASLDGANRTTVIDLFVDLARQGRTVVVATHDDEMIEACDVRVPLAAAHTQQPSEHQGETR